MPAESEWEAIDFAIERSKESEKKLMNTWGYGYWVEWRGVEPSAKGWFHSQNYNQNAIVLEDLDLNSSYCEKLETFKRIDVYDCHE